MMDGRAASMHPASIGTFLVFFFTSLTAPSLASAASASGSTPPSPSGFRIHLRGVARIDAHAARSQGKLVVSGTVSDDLGGGTAGTRVAVEIARAPSDPNGTSSAPAAHAPGSTGSSSPSRELVPLATSAPEMCTDVTQAPVLEGADRMVVPTAVSAPTSTQISDGAARFCVRLALPVGRYVVRLEARPAGLVDGARLDLPVDLGLEAVSLRFDPDAPVRSLDEEVATVDVTASTEDDGITHAASALPLALTNELGSPVGSAVTDGAGAARFHVAGALLGPAGRGELRVAFAGNAIAGASMHASPVERRTHVTLDFPDAIDGRLPPGSSTSELALRVIARTTCAARGCSGSPTGTVEVRLAEGGDGSLSGEGVVGAASLREGVARIVTTFGAPFDRGGEARLRVRYVPDAPWFLPNDAPPLVQPLRPPSAWREFGIAGAGLFVVAWLAVSRVSLRPRASRRKVRRTLVEEARVEVVTGSVSAGSFRGRVVDAHEGVSVAGARLAIERAGFESSTVVAETVSDASGAFALPDADVRPGDQLVAEGAWHERVRFPRPPAGELLVTLVARRRALLDRLVAWARRRGPPFDAMPEPTPGQVGKAAGSTPWPDAGPGGTANAGIRAWAGAVERAVYGGDAVDAAREAEVDSLAPPDATTPRGARPR
jgi:hypothetical protein